MLPFDLSDQADKNEADNYSFKKITLTDNTTIPPSTLLSDTAWVTYYVIRLLDLETTTDTTTEVSTTEKEKVDLLLIKWCE
jgi:hypothetical protein